MLQAGRSRVRFSMKPLEIDPFLPAALLAFRSTQPLSENSSPCVKGGRLLRLTTSASSVSQFSEKEKMCEPWRMKTFYSLLQRQFYVSLSACLSAMFSMSLSVSMVASQPAARYIKPRVNRRCWVSPRVGAASCLHPVYLHAKHRVLLKL
jgi:hypothetical protein